MKRLHLFEFEDFYWFPDFLRNLVTDYLYFMVNTFHFYEVIIPILQKNLKKMNCQKIIDLGSGGAGPWPILQRHLRKKSFKPIEIILTDKYPNMRAIKRFSKIEANGIKYARLSVDAANVPTNLNGFRTMFNSFHHFNPKEALKILNDASQKNEGIAIFELTGRDPVMLIYVLLSPLVVILLTPFIRPFSWKRILFTYLLPIVPVIVVWDGMVSNLRTYSVGELKSLCQNIALPNYNCEIGQVRNIYGIKITYLIGLPKINANKSE